VHTSEPPVEIPKLDLDFSVAKFAENLTSGAHGVLAS
jgi:hypothetical protein